ncbi:LysM domain-containing protein [Noviherbaspirillum humi]|uniref:LysM domain-containing protein n=1 Tax=Noviherbaspirillum humi TaxID=1688639 RepID=A0A239C8E3_9BURK|nr:LysM peptidoglycan-binding domain-containing protein [Noviherbaspirillum humi]SNS16380.1 LysM domain-containing protein [Noviherbaspirillum humi]
MKKFSTAALFLSLLSASAGFAADAGQPANDPRCAFLASAPDQHVVVRGDTLWGISGRFLSQPWCWPQVWGMNREQIRNPHWIYPGQIVYLDRAAGRLRLGNAIGSGNQIGNADGDTLKLKPQIRSEELSAQSIPSIPSHLIEPFLSQPLVIGPAELNGAPRIIAAEANRVILGKNDKAFVRGDIGNVTSFQVFRPGVPLRDPVNGAVIGYEAAYLGTVNLARAARAPNEAHMFTVAEVKQEMGIGDRLVPLPPAPVLNYVPHAPEKPVDARVVSVYGGVSHAGQNQIVTINRGSADGIDAGTVLDLYRLGTIVPDRTDRRQPVKLPDQQYGSLFVFRTFDRISYALVMQVTDSVQVGDPARSSE